MYDIARGLHNILICYKKLSDEMINLEAHFSLHKIFGYMKILPILDHSEPL
jgi:hypothetical protein